MRGGVVTIKDPAARQDQQTNEGLLEDGVHGFGAARQHRPQLA
jgi:hypothetical protein